MKGKLFGLVRGGLDGFCLSTMFLLTAVLAVHSFVGWVEQGETQRQPFVVFEKCWVSLHSTQPTWLNIEIVKQELLVQAHSQAGAWEREKTL